MEGEAEQVLSSVAADAAAWIVVLVSGCSGLDSCSGRVERVD